MPSEEEVFEEKGCFGIGDGLVFQQLLADVLY